MSIFRQIQSDAARSDSAAVGRCHSPNGVGKVVCDNECTTRIYRHTDGSASGPALFVEKAGNKVDRLARRTTIRERDKDYFEADRRATIPAAVLTDKHTLRECSTHSRRREVNAQGCHMRAERVVRRDGGCDFLGVLGP